MEASPVPQERRIRRLIVVLVLLVAAIVVAAAFAAWTAMPPSGPPIFVTFDDPVLGGPGAATVRIAEASREVALGSFRVQLLTVTNQSVVFDVVLRAGVLFANGTATASLNDTESPGRLGVGDTFLLEDFRTQTTYALLLTYATDSRTLDSVTIPL